MGKIIFERDFLEWFLFINYLPHLWDDESEIWPSKKLIIDRNWGQKSAKFRIFGQKLSEMAGQNLVRFHCK